MPQSPPSSLSSQLGSELITIEVIELSDLQPICPRCVGTPQRSDGTGAPNGSSEEAKRKLSEGVEWGGGGDRGAGDGFHSGGQLGEKKGKKKIKHGGQERGGALHAAPGAYIEL